DRNQVSGAPSTSGRVHVPSCSRRCLLDQAGLTPACKSSAAHVPQCACGVSPRRIFGSDVRPCPVLSGSLSRGSTWGTLPATPDRTDTTAAENCRGDATSPQ